MKSLGLITVIVATCLLWGGVQSQKRFLKIEQLREVIDREIGVDPLPSNGTGSGTRFLTNPPPSNGTGSETGTVTNPPPSNGTGSETGSLTDPPPTSGTGSSTRFKTDALIILAEERKAERIAAAKEDNDQTAALEVQSSSPRIALSSPRIQQSVGRSGNNAQNVLQADPNIFIYIGPDFVIFLGSTYPIVDGKIEINGVSYLVCGLGIAREDAYICCQTNLFPRSLGPIACCDTAFIFTDEEFCCGDIFFPFVLPGGLNLGCCGLSEPYLRNNESCCSGEVVVAPVCPGECPPGLISAICCNGLRLGAGQTCCNGLIVNGFICPCVPGSNSPGCCNGLRLGAGQICCQGSIVNGPVCPCTFGSNLNGCCNGLRLGFGQTCCQGAIVNGPVCPCAFGSNLNGCCNGLRLGAGQICCQGSIVNGAVCDCLPGSNSPGCCNGWRIGAGQSCCRGTIFNGIVCPPFPPPPPPPPPPPTATCPGVSPFNPFTRDLRCCGGRAYNVVTNICCGNRRYHRSAFCCLAGRPVPVGSCP